ncbi:DinB family protein [Loktanella sp. S4079]|uniref:DinB family protein n=1 Tax=Loktanella sp. S4079 TaxID=579483 RepID=UPI0005F9F45D|nr:DinB family protein [Loktanella sp. S4079]KJZ20069.1 damage-inducible protein DinB [Loktanella sp. S4079]
MITPEYCQMMAAYNAWQNNGLRDLVQSTSQDVLTRDRGAFFGSIFGTLNHLLWADTVWIARLDKSSGTDVALSESTAFSPTPAVWAAERFRMDGRIAQWADKLHTVDLVGPLSWHSAALGQTVTKPMSQCVVHMFNHQTHHRGQIHAMLTAAGENPIATDLPFMPET